MRHGARPSRAAAAAALLLAAIGYGRAAESRLPPPQRVVLKNGMQLLILERRSVPLVQLQLMVRGGSILDPPGREGTAHLLARLLKRGTPGRSADQFAEQVESMGGTLLAEAGLERTIVAGEFAARDLSAALDLLSAMVRTPLLPEEEFEQERGLAEAELEGLIDEPDGLAGRAFGSWMFGTHPYGRPAAGTRRSLKILTRQDLAAFHQAHFVPARSLLVLVGDFTPEQARRAVERSFSSWAGKAAAEPRVPPPQQAKGRRILLIDRPDATQSQLRFGNLGPVRSASEYIPLTVDNAILGTGFTSWLVDEIRVRRGLTYNIGSRLTARRAAGLFSVSTQSKNETAVEALTLSIGLLQKMRQAGPSGQDLDKGRNFVAGLFPLSIESPDDLAAALLDVEFYGLGADYLDRYPARVRSVDQEAARAAARLIPADDLAIVVVGPADALRSGLEAIGPVTVRQADALISGAP